MLDDASLEDEGISRDTPITLFGPGLPFKSVLMLLRNKYGLHYLVQGNMLLVTSRKTAQSDENLIRRVYPAGSLVDGEDYDSLIKAITTTVDRGTWQTSCGYGTVVAVKSSKCLVVAQNARRARQGVGIAGIAANRRGSASRRTARNSSLPT